MDSATLGQDIRSLRKARALTLGELAGQLKRSVGWLSQIERDLATPRTVDLERIADALGVPVGALLEAAPAEERGRIVRAGARRSLGHREIGLTEELLSPDLSDPFEVIHSIFAAGASKATEVRRATQEVGHIIEGQLDIWIEGERFSLATGDSFRLRGEAFRWANPYDTRAVAIWVIAPPVY